MSTQTKPAAVVLQPIAAAVAALVEAGTASATMLQQTREAAKLAAAQLSLTDAKASIADKVKAVCLCYATALDAAGHNVKALFVDALTLHAAAAKGITVTKTVKDSGGASVDVQVNPTEAIDWAKHGFRGAATEVRQKAGEGRAPKAAKATTAAGATVVQTPAASAPMNDIDKFNAWADDLSGYLADAVFHKRLAERLAETGWKLARIKAKA